MALPHVVPLSLCRVAVVEPVDLAPGFDVRGDEPRGKCAIGPRAAGLIRAGVRKGSASTRGEAPEALRPGDLTIGWSVYCAPSETEVPAASS